jgi:putative IMPACT (imprinted ancient) family translation regulator
VPAIRTLSRALTHEVDKVRGSRFVVDVAPAATEAQALAFVGAVGEREAGASHHCWAFRLQDGRERCSDDGEPSGSAGAPILRHLCGSGVVDAVVVVTRWFGGTKLGTGGLVRAYGGAAGAALSMAAAEGWIVERPVVATIELVHDYDLSGAVDGVIAGHGGSVLDADYGASVTVRLALPIEGAAAFVDAVAEATSGRVVGRVVGG